MMLLYWHSHWTLLPLQTLDPGHRVSDEFNRAILFLAHVPYPGMVEPNGLRGGGSRDDLGGASAPRPAVAAEQPVMTAAQSSTRPEVPSVQTHASAWTIDCLLYTSPSPRDSTSS
eukprot:8413381-Prorocentrum_lima.AAC.1